MPRSYPISHLDPRIATRSTSSRGPGQGTTRDVLNLRAFLPLRDSILSSSLLGAWRREWLRRASPDPMAGSGHSGLEGSPDWTEDCIYARRIGQHICSFCGRPWPRESSPLHPAVATYPLSHCCTSSSVLKNLGTLATAWWSSGVWKLADFSPFSLVSGGTRDVAGFLRRIGHADLIEPQYRPNCSSMIIVRVLLVMVYPGRFSLSEKARIRPLKVCGSSRDVVDARYRAFALPATESEGNSLILHARMRSDSLPRKLIGTFGKAIERGEQLTSLKPSAGYIRLSL